MCLSHQSVYPELRWCFRCSPQGRRVDSMHALWTSYCTYPYAHEQRFFPGTEIDGSRWDLSLWWVLTALTRLRNKESIRGTILRLWQNSQQLNSSLIFYPAFNHRLFSVTVIMQEVLNRLSDTLQEDRVAHVQSATLLNCFILITNALSHNHMLLCAPFRNWTIPLFNFSP